MILCLKETKKRIIYGNEKKSFTTEYNFQNILFPINTFRFYKTYKNSRLKTYTPKAPSIYFHYF